MSNTELRKAATERATVKMKNSAAKKYISPYALTRMKHVYDHFPHGGKDMPVVKHERGNVDFWYAKRTTKPKIAYTVLRLHRRRAGQLELLPVLKEKACLHPPQRLFSWVAYDNTLCVGCCVCGEILSGAVDAEGNDVGKQIKMKGNKKAQKRNKKC